MNDYFDDLLKDLNEIERQEAERERELDERRHHPVEPDNDIETEGREFDADIRS